MLTKIYLNILNQPRNDGLTKTTVGFYTSKQLAQESIAFSNKYQLYANDYNTIKEVYLEGELIKD